MKSVLFICTGNVFRSMVAEYALKAYLGPVPGPGYAVGSAGTEAVPQPVHPAIRARLLEKGADSSGHVPRRLTRELLEAADVPVAMGLDHREFIHCHFGREVQLFNQICYQKEEPILDVHEAVPDWHVNPQASLEYAAAIIEYIWNAMPAFLARLPHLRTER